MSDTFKIDINETAMQTLVADSIMKMLTPEKRDELLTQATRYLLAPSSNSSYGRATSPLQDAFNSALSSFARTYMEKIVSEDETFKSKVKELIQKGTEKFFTDDQTAIINNVAAAITKGLTDDKYR